jgi:type VI secretion system protein ImpK
VALIDSFHDFYKELLAVNEQLDSGRISSAVAQSRLASTLNRQEAWAERESGSEGREKFHRAKYAMAALADEILLNPDHPHAESWEAHLLERELFHSQSAGERIFENVDTLLPNLGTSGKELARVYLAVLGLGFQGVYRLTRGSGDDVARAETFKKELKRSREKLFNLAYGPDAEAGKLQRRVVPGAYEPTITDAHAGQLPHLRPWIYAMVLLVVLYVGGTFALWRRATGDLAPKVQEINHIPIRSTARPAQ